jgi:hypothetical protein
MKYNSVGDTILSQHYPSLVSDYLIFNCSNVTNDSGYIFTGDIAASPNSYTNILVLKTDSLGNEFWRISYGGNASDKGFSIIQTPDSGYVVGGYSYSPGQNNSGDPLIVKFDKNGNYQWNRKPGGPFDDTQAMVCLNQDSTFTILTIHADSEIFYDAEYGRIHIMNYSSSGNLNWEKFYGQSRYMNCVGNIKSLNDSGWVSCGYYWDYDDHHFKGWILRINSSSDSMW